MPCHARVGDDGPVGQGDDRPKGSQGLVGPRLAIRGPRVATARDALRHTTGREAATHGHTNQTQGLPREHDEQNTQHAEQAQKQAQTHKPKGNIAHSTTIHAKKYIEW